MAGPQTCAAPGCSAPLPHRASKWCTAHQASGNRARSSRRQERSDEVREELTERLRIAAPLLLSQLRTVLPHSTPTELCRFAGLDFTDELADAALAQAEAHAAALPDAASLLRVGLYSLAVMVLARQHEISPNMLAGALKALQGVLQELAGTTERLYPVIELLEPETLASPEEARARSDH